MTAHTQPKTRGRQVTLVDTHIGQRIRKARLARGMNQRSLAEAVGLTFQQIQKNERGANGVRGSRLYALSAALEVPVEHFFIGLDNPTVTPLHVPMRLMRAFSAIKTPALRERVYELVKAIAAMQSGSS